MTGAAPSRSAGRPLAARPTFARAALHLVGLPLTLPQPLDELARNSLLLASLAALVLASGCKHAAPSKKEAKEISESGRREAVAGFKEAIERAGGFDVWVKGASHSRAEAPVEVLVVSSLFDAVLSAIEAQARKESFAVSVRTAQEKNRRRLAEVRVSSGNEPLDRWRLREVPRLRRAAILVDDLGQDLEAARKILQMAYPLTLSVLPDLRFSARTAEEAHGAGREVMLHLPMEPESASLANPGPGAIEVGMGSDEVERIIESDLATVPHAAGVNNHMGSRATADTTLMAEVMEALQARRLYFIDSRTTAATTALNAARRRGIPAFYRSVFLDDTPSTAYTLDQLRRFRSVVEEQGAGLAIGHPYPTTFTALAEFLPSLERDDIQLVSASELVRLPQAALLSPRNSASNTAPLRGITDETRNH